jgi:hypothetical protein
LSDANCVAGRFSVTVQAIRLLDPTRCRPYRSWPGTASAPITVDVEASEGPFGDERGDFESNAYIGLAIDTFGAQELNKYLNPEANGQLHERSIFGIDFSYRLFGKGGAPDLGLRRNGPRCAQRGHRLRADARAAVVQEGAGGVRADLAKASLFLLRNATSLEAYVGLRVELAQLNLPGLHPAAST